MQRKKNPVKNRLQIAVIVGVLGFVLYGYVLYNRIRVFRYDHIFWYVMIEIAWLLITVYWWLQWRKSEREEKEE